MATFKRQTGSGWEHISLPVNIGMSPQTLGYAEVTANQAVTTEVDLTGLTVTVVVPEGRRLRITGHTLPSSSVASDEAEVYIYEGGTKLATAAGALGAVGGGSSVDPVAIVSPSAGAHTYKLRAARSVGTGTVQMNAGVGYSSFILVEDITGSTLPYQPASVPVGQLAYAEVSANQTFTTLVDLTGLSININVPAGRTVRISARLYISSTVAADAVLAYLFEGPTQLGRAEITVSSAGRGYTVELERIISPSAGTHTYKLSAERGAGGGTITSNAAAHYPAYLMAEDITPTPAPSSGAPGSTLGYAEVTANQTGITAQADLTGLSVTVTVPAGRRLRIRALALFQNTAAGNRTLFAINEGATTLRTMAFVHGAANVNETFQGDVVLTPTAGTHTYKLVAAAEAGTSALGASSTGPAFILVEDITGSVWPEGSAVTAGMVASEAWTSYTPTLTQGVSVPVTVISARYTKMGRTVHFATRLIAAGAGTLGQPIYIGLPPHASLAAGVTMVGVGTLYDASANLRYQGLAALPSTTTIGLLPVNGTGNGYLGVYDFVAALATNDEIFVSGTYEAAS